MTVTKTERKKYHYCHISLIHHWTKLFLWWKLFHKLVVPERPAPPIVGKVTANSIELYWDQAVTTEDVSGGRLRYCIQEEEDDTRKGFGNVYKWVHLCWGVNSVKWPVTRENWVFLWNFTKKNNNKFQTPSAPFYIATDMETWAALP